ncbi:hypothetical protein PRZ48_005983 [Zasmidium cellare]|uniref:Zn(2)-C6 fungal-type domain-containing protein n=1 Tax=Zasmidium cellare TaxID=395010 RepID=A0ABR0EM39_ZASCE|nr:hypothetical protein PRZ48_005983 [Zasmidium cellare]
MTNQPPAHGDHDHGSNDERPTKRKRIALACTKCRERKSKCDGVTPECGLCRQMATECSYPPPLSKTDVLRQEFTSMVGGLEDRIGGIERMLTSFQQTLTTPAGREPVTPNSRTSAPITPAQPGSESDITITEDAFQSSSQPEPASDGIGIVPMTSREDCAFFGPSSNIAFLRLVSRALARHSGPGNGSAGPQSNIPENERLNVRGRQEANADQSMNLFGGTNANGHGNQTFKIPSDQRTRELLAEYFRNCGLVHPYVHEGRFMETYEAVRRSNFRTVRRSWLALLYMLLALSSLSSPYESASVAIISAESEEWFNLASDLCLKQVFSETGINLEVAQVLMWMALYLQGTHSSMRTCVIHGMAVRIAYQLGLHSGEASKLADPIEQEYRKRTWFGLVLLDCTLSMTYGRPPQIHDPWSTLEKPTAYADSVQRGFLAADELSVGFLYANIRLFEILQKAIQRLYGNNSGARMAFNVENIAKVYTLEGEILQWSKDLPPQLAVMQCNQVSAEALPLTVPLEILGRRQRTVLTLRHLNARILIHRPVLEGLLDAMSTESVDIDYLQVIRQAGANSVSFAVTCATKLIYIMHRLLGGSNREQGSQQLGAWWFSLYYTFNASLAILGALVVSRERWDCPSILTKKQRESAIEALYQTLGVLDGLDKGHSTVTRCRSYIQELIAVASPLLSDEDPVQFDNASFNADFTAGMSMPFDQNSLRQLASNVDLESFLFPTDLTALSGNAFWD